MLQLRAVELLQRCTEAHAWVKVVRLGYSKTSDRGLTKPRTPSATEITRTIPPPLFLSFHPLLNLSSLLHPTERDGTLSPPLIIIVSTTIGSPFSTTFPPSPFSSNISSWSPSCTSLRTMFFFQNWSSWNRDKQTKLQEERLFKCKIGNDSGSHQIHTWV